MLPLVSGWRSQGFTDTSVPVAYDRYVRRQLFDPWARDRGQYYSLEWKPQPRAVTDPAFKK